MAHGIVTIRRRGLGHRVGRLADPHYEEHRPNAHHGDRDERRHQRCIGGVEEPGKNGAKTYARQRAADAESGHQPEATASDEDARSQRSHQHGEDDPQRDRHRQATGKPKEVGGGTHGNEEWHEAGKPGHHRSRRTAQHEARMQVMNGRSARDRVPDSQCEEARDRYQRQERADPPVTVSAASPSHHDVEGEVRQPSRQPRDC